MLLPLDKGTAPDAKVNPAAGKPLFVQKPFHVGNEKMNEKQIYRFHSQIHSFLTVRTFTFSPRLQCIMSVQ